jgi:hypothetical protein
MIKDRQLFFLDGAGAILSAFLVGVVLVMYQYVLALMACGLAVHSLYCYFSVTTRWRFHLKIVAIANLLYCCLTAALVIYYHKELTLLGILYFVVEMALVSGLAYWEYKVATVQ